MKLDIIVPRYKEEWAICHYLFDSIALQRGISFDDIHVLVINDGEEDVLDKTPFLDYPYEVTYIVKEHGGVSAARNYGLDQSDADYVMFCDADDGFLSNYGLHLVFSAMQEGFDYLISNFVEETYTDKGIMTILRHDRDLTFMHGKAYRRSFLVENRLRFDPDMTLHEDGYFNMLVYVAALHGGKLKFVDTPFYLWRWNDHSTVRSKREDFVLRTYRDVMKTRIGLCNELDKRGYQEDFRTAVCMTVLNSYYDFQKPSYHLPRNEKHRKNAERAFRQFWNLYGNVFRDSTNLLIAELAKAARDTATRNGMLMERQDLKTWLRYIENDVK